jgi:hypothetical protein
MYLHKTWLFPRFFFGMPHSTTFQPLRPPPTTQKQSTANESVHIAMGKTYLQRTGGAEFLGTTCESERQIFYLQYLFSEFVKRESLWIFIPSNSISSMLKHINWACTRMKYSITCIACNCRLLLLVFAGWERWFHSHMTYSGFCQKKKFPRVVLCLAL